VSTVTIDGADHFFRDFFADDVVEAIADFMQQH
jgi:alpha/beta superfamily hydrolase